MSGEEQGLIPTGFSLEVDVATAAKGIEKVSENAIKLQSELDQLDMKLKTVKQSLRDMEEIAKKAGKSPVEKYGEIYLLEQANLKTLLQTMPALMTGIAQLTNMAAEAQERYNKAIGKTKQLTGAIGSVVAARGVAGAGGQKFDPFGAERTDVERIRRELYQELQKIDEGVAPPEAINQFTRAIQTLRTELEGAFSRQAREVSEEDMPKLDKAFNDVRNNVERLGKEFQDAARAIDKTGTALKATGAFQVVEQLDTALAQLKNQVMLNEISVEKWLAEITALQPRVSGNIDLTKRWALELKTAQQVMKTFEKQKLSDALTKISREFFTGDKTAKQALDSLKALFKEVEKDEKSANKVYTTFKKLFTLEYKDNIDKVRFALEQMSREFETGDIKASEYKAVLMQLQTVFADDTAMLRKLATEMSNLDKKVAANNLKKYKEYLELLIGVAKKGEAEFRVVSQKIKEMGAAAAGSAPKLEMLARAEKELAKVGKSQTEQLIVENIRRIGEAAGRGELTVSQLRQQLQFISEEARKAGYAIGLISQEIVRVGKAATTKAFDEPLNRLNTQLNKGEIGLREYIAQLRIMQTQFAATSKESADLGNMITNAQKRMGAMAKQVTILGQAFKTARHHAIWMLSGELLFPLYNLPRNVLEIVKKLDTSFAKLKSVLQLSADDMGFDGVDKKFNELKNSAFVFAKYYGEEVEKVNEVLFTTAQKYKRNADIIIVANQVMKISLLDYTEDVEKTVGQMISLSAQLNILPKDYERFTNMVIVAGAQVKATAGEILEAMTRNASMFQNMNADMATQIAINAASMEKTGQTARVIGTAWRNLLTNIGGLEKVQILLKKYGIQVYDDVQNTKEFYLVFKQMKEQFETMTPELQNYFITAVGGKRQMQYLNTALKDVGNTVDVLRGKISVSNEELARLVKLAMFTELTTVDRNIKRLSASWEYFILRLAESAEFKDVFTSFTVGSIKTLDFLAKYSTELMQITKFIGEYVVVTKLATLWTKNYAASFGAAALQANVASLRIASIGVAGKAAAGGIGYLRGAWAGLMTVVGPFLLTLTKVIVLFEALEAIRKKFDSQEEKETRRWEANIMLAKAYQEAAKEGIQLDAIAANAKLPHDIGYSLEENRKMIEERQKIIDKIKSQNIDSAKDQKKFWLEIEKEMEKELEKSRQKQAENTLETISGHDELIAKYEKELQEQKTQADERERIFVKESEAQKELDDLTKLYGADLKQIDLRIQGLNKSYQENLRLLERKKAAIFDLMDLLPGQIPSNELLMFYAEGYNELLKDSNKELSKTLETITGLKVQQKELLGLQTKMNTGTVDRQKSLSWIQKNQGDYLSEVKKIKKAAGDFGLEFDEEVLTPSAASSGPHWHFELADALRAEAKAAGGSSKELSKINIELQNIAANKGIEKIEGITGFRGTEEFKMRLSYLSAWMEKEYGQALQPSTSLEAQTRSFKKKSGHMRGSAHYTDMAADTKFFGLEAQKVAKTTEEIFDKTGERLETEIEQVKNKYEEVGATITSLTEYAADHYKRVKELVSSHVQAVQSLYDTIIGREMEYYDWQLEQGKISNEKWLYNYQVVHRQALESFKALGIDVDEIQKRLAQNPLAYFGQLNQEMNSLTMQSLKLAQSIANEKDNLAKQNLIRIKEGVDAELSGTAAVMSASQTLYNMNKEIAAQEKAADERARERMNLRKQGVDLKIQKEILQLREAGVYSELEEAKIRNKYQKDWLKTQDGIIKDKKKTLDLAREAGNIEASMQAISELNTAELEKHQYLYELQQAIIQGMLADVEKKYYLETKNLEIQTQLAYGEEARLLSLRAANLELQIAEEKMGTLLEALRASGDSLEWNDLLGNDKFVTLFEQISSLKAEILNMDPAFQAMKQAGEDAGEGIKEAMRDAVKAIAAGEKNIGEAFRDLFVRQGEIIKETIQNAIAEALIIKAGGGIKDFEKQMADLTGTIFDIFGVDRPASQEPVTLETLYDSSKKAIRVTDAESQKAAEGLTKKLASGDFGGDIASLFTGGGTSGGIGGAVGKGVGKFGNMAGGGKMGGVQGVQGADLMTLAATIFSGQSELGPYSQMLPSLGYSLGAAAGAGSLMGQLGAAAGPVGMVLGVVVGQWLDNALGVGAAETRRETAHAQNQGWDERTNNVESALEQLGFGEDYVQNAVDQVNQARPVLQHGRNGVWFETNDVQNLETVLGDQEAAIERMQAAVDGYNESVDDMDRNIAMGIGVFDAFGNEITNWNQLILESLEGGRVGLRSTADAILTYEASLQRGTSGLSGDFNTLTSQIELVQYWLRQMSDAGMQASDVFKDVQQQLFDLNQTKYWADIFAPIKESEWLEEFGLVTKETLKENYAQAIREAFGYQGDITDEVIKTLADQISTDVMLLQTGQVEGPLAEDIQYRMDLLQAMKGLSDEITDANLAQAAVGGGSVGESISGSAQVVQNEYNYNLDVQNMFSTEAESNGVIKWISQQQKKAGFIQPGVFNI